MLLACRERIGDWLDKSESTGRAVHSVSAAATCESTLSRDALSSVSATKTVLETRNLTRRFGGLLAVNDVSLTVAPQEILGVIGPNGAGKTTFFNLLSGTIPSTTGEIRLKDEPIHGLPPYRIAQLGIGRTFQIVRPFSQLTVLENVLAGIGARYCRGFSSALGKHHTPERRDEAHFILEQTGLADYANETSRNLPLGLLRRLEIARALGLRPGLILLDESFSGLSNRECSSLFELVQNLRDRGGTIMLIEHNMQITMNICDRIAVLDHGEKIAEGLPDEIRSNQRVVAAYLGSDDHA